MKKLVLAALALTPALAFAQNPDLRGIEALVLDIGAIVDAAIPIVFGILVIAFLWGLVRFVFAAGSEVDKEKGKNLMIYSILALFVAASIWGIVRWIGGILDVDSTTSIPAPKVSP